MKRYLPLPFIAAVLLLAGCGGSHKRSIPTINATCPPNLAQMGCNAPHPLTLQKFGSAPAGLEFPDVSVWQGAVGWPSVKAWQVGHPGWHAAAIFKLGEYTLDNQVGRNASETARLGFWRAGYWFLRNTGCAHEAGLIVWAAQRYGLKVVVLDAEVPEARGYSSCLAPPLQRAGLAVVEYTSPGANPDGSNPGVKALWPAAYGPSHVPCLFTCSVGDLSHQSILAWQFTDGRFGPVVSIPGIGSDDVSVDYGITRLGAPVTPPAPVYPLCYSHRIPAAQCAAVKRQVASYGRAQASSQRAYVARGCVALSAREQWFAAAIKRQPHTRVAYRKGALAATRKALARQQCSLFASRAGYYGSLVKQTTAGH